jgi:hypothetical protein
LLIVAVSAFAEMAAFLARKSLLALRTRQMVRLLFYFCLTVRIRNERNAEKLSGTVSEFGGEGRALGGEKEGKR